MTPVFLINAIDDFLAETCGVVCCSQRHDDMLQEARDKLHAAAMQAKRDRIAELERAADGNSATV